MIDRYGRRVTYLRVSLTNRCQLDCSYCTLQEEPADILRPQELGTILGVAVNRLGIRKVRLTGGEPTLRKDLPEVVERIASLEGMREVALTTNALLLDRRAEALAEAGLTTVNVSCDSLIPKRFSELTGGGDLDQVLRGLRAAREAGIPKRKLNVVLMGGVNEDEVESFVRFAGEEDVEVRFIEHMPMDGDRLAQWKVDPKDVLRSMSAGGELVPLPTSRDGGPAERFQIGSARVGFIHAISNPFCDRCNRLRVTAEGKIRSCLLTGGEVDLAAAVRSGKPAEEVEQELLDLFRLAADSKPPIYDLQREGTIPMRSIGG